MNREKGIFLFFCNNILLKKAYLFSIPNFRFKAAPFIYTIQEIIFLVVLILKGNSLEKGILDFDFDFLVDHIRYLYGPHVV